MDVLAQGFQWDEAEDCERAEDTFNRGDIDAILSRYADDVVVRFAGIREIRGKTAAETFLRARLPSEKLQIEEDAVYGRRLQDRRHLYRFVEGCKDRQTDAR